MPVLHQFFHLPFSNVLPVLSTNAYWVISSSIFFILYHRKYDKYHWAGNANLRFSYVVILRETRSNYLKLIYFPKWNFIYSTKGKQIWKVIISLLTTHWGTRRPKRPDRLLLLLSHFSCVRLCATPKLAAHQDTPSLGFSRQEHWSGLPFPFPVHESEKWQWSCSVVPDS